MIKISEDKTTAEIKLGELLFKLANEYISLGRTCGGDISKEGDYSEEDAFLSPYICDGLTDCIAESIEKTLDGRLYYSLMDALKESVQRYFTNNGMKTFGLNVWEHIDSDNRQEARWFFLMLLAEKHKGKTITVKL